MKRLLVILILLLSAQIYAQNSKVEVTTTDETTVVKVGRSENISVQESDGATRIRVGSTEINVADENVSVRFWQELERNKFRGHWAGFELGFNTYAKTDYSGYAPQNFMDLRVAKSLTTRINFLQYDLGLGRKRKNVGILTGLGLESKDFRFSNDYSLQVVDGKTVALPLEYDRVKKSKLNVFYATVPLLFEVQIPTENEGRRFYVGAGVEGGLRIGSHTKIKYKKDGDWEKDKNRDRLNVNNFKLDAQLRLGYGGLNLFVNYALVDLFEDGKAPQITPLTVGFTLVTF